MEFPSKIVYEGISELFENGYPNEKLQTLIGEVRSYLNVKDANLAIYEENRDVLRIVAGEKELISKKINKAELMKSPKVEINGESYFVVQLRFEKNIIGALLLSDEISLKKYEIYFESLSSALFYSYNLFLSRMKMTRMEKLLEITDVFGNTENIEDLFEKFVNAMFEHLPSEIIFIAKKTGEDFQIVKSRPKVYTNLFIPGFSDFSLSIFANEPQIIIKPKFENSVVDVKIKSLITVPFVLNKNDEKYWLVFINKTHGRGYIPEKSYESFDLDIAIDATKRFQLAFSRLTFYEKLKKEIEKLKKLRIEHERLIENQKEQLRKMNMVHYISQAMRSSYDPKDVLKILLIGLTSGRTLGFNRALLLMKDSEKEVLVGKAWIGPATGEEVEKEWKVANQRAMRYGDVVQYLIEESIGLTLDNELTKKIKGKIFPFKSHRFLERAVVRGKIVHVNEKVILETQSPDFLLPILETNEFVIVPLIGKNDTIGVVILDNKYSKQPISPTDIEILRVISDSAGLAIENSINYSELREKTLNLEKQKYVIEYLKDFSELVLQNLSAAVVVLDREGKITEWNRKAENYFRKNKEQMLGKKLSILGRYFVDIEEMCNKVLYEKNEIKLTDYQIQILDQEKFFDVSISPLWDAERIMVRGTIITFEDVTERVFLEQERKKQEKLAVLGEMSARVVHELRNPISVLGGFIKRLEKYSDDENKRKKYLKIISDEILRLENIVSEILEFSRDKKVLNFEEFNLNELISEVFLLHEEKIKTKNIMFEFKTDSERIEIYADKSRIKQVLINLLQNAIDETPEGGKIEFRVKKELNTVKVIIWNQGQPIPKEILKKLFTPFFTTKVHGTGLGLPICKKIIEEEHNGKIWVEPTEDGNSFIFELPYKKEGEA
ncbi:GAF domain-containing sensor histidine kinase [Thermosipho atlanticus]|uniref:histidine kinase n=1 Tax=Thermosipho atlanticus DSM 15807 TaxID=1123380 RepID=A0A1M5RT25_9BACT|nr:GAF domain-containing sensor histidine kinase [Thermosipho atlanticus]SHH29502.1 PAS/PAC sensor signal transduction histidine kinase [Thermosipho atlanticus DSM 15807]